MIVCPLCNRLFNCLNNTHLKSHNLTVAQFKETFPNYKMQSDEISKSLSRKGNIKLIDARKKQSIKTKQETIEKFQALDKRCQHCNEKILFENRRNKFCNHSCAASIRNKGRKTIYSEAALKIMQKNGRENAQINFREFWGAKRELTPIFNTCIFCKKVFEPKNRNKTLKLCSPECLHEHRSKNNARQGTFGKSGFYKGVFCGSTWELAFLIFNQDAGKNIERCPLTFEYMLEDGKHTYFPDFMMDNIIYEVKGREYGSLVEKNQAVINAGYQIKMIKKAEIEPIIKAVKQKYNVKNLLKLYDHN